MKAGEQHRRREAVINRQHREGLARSKKRQAAAGRVFRAVKKEVKKPMPQATGARAGGGPDPGSVAPLSPVTVRVFGGLLAFVGLVLCALFLPLGLIVLAFGVYELAAARKICDRHNAKLQEGPSVDTEGGGL